MAALLDVNVLVAIAFSDWARRHGGKVVTFDRSLASAGGDDVTCLLPPDE